MNLCEWNLERPSSVPKCDNRYELPLHTTHWPQVRDITLLTYWNVSWWLCICLGALLLRMVRVKDSWLLCANGTVVTYNCKGFITRKSYSSGWRYLPIF